MTPPAKARQIDITCPCSHAAVAPPNGPKQAAAVSWCSSAVRLASTLPLPTPAQAFEEARKTVDNKVEEQTGRWRVSDFGRFIPIPRKVALKRWTEGYLSPGIALSFLPRY